MKTNISRAKSYLLMAEAAITEVRREVEDAEKDPKMSEDSFLDVAVAARKLLKVAIKRQILGDFQAHAPEFIRESMHILAKLDSILGQELNFEEEVCRKLRNQA